MAFRFSTCILVGLLLLQALGPAYAFTNHRSRTSATNSRKPYLEGGVSVRGSRTQVSSKTRNYLLELFPNGLSDYPTLFEMLTFGKFFNWPDGLQYIESFLPGIIPDRKFLGESPGMYHRTVMMTLGICFTNVDQCQIKNGRMTGWYSKDFILFGPIVLGKGMYKPSEIEEMYRNFMSDNTFRRCFIQALNFFVLGLGDVTKPSGVDLSKGAPFRWIPACQDVYNKNNAANLVYDLQNASSGSNQESVQNGEVDPKVLEEYKEYVQKNQGLKNQGFKQFEQMSEPK